MREFTYNALPVRIVFGSGAARTRLAPEIERLGARRVLLVASEPDTDRVRGLVDPFAERVAAVFTAVREHVPLATAEAARAAAAAPTRTRAEHRRWVDDRRWRRLSLSPPASRRRCADDVLGSEVTPVWGFTEMVRKTTGVDPAVLPRVVVYDPELTARSPGLGRRERASTRWRTGSRRSGRRGATRSARDRRGRACRGTGRRSAQARSCGVCSRGAWLAGAAFAVAGSGLHHKICHVLGGAFDLPHARTHAVVLPHVLAFNAPGAPDAAVRIGRALGVGPAPSTRSRGCVSLSPSWVSRGAARAGDD